VIILIVNDEVQFRLDILSIFRHYCDDELYKIQRNKVVESHARLLLCCDCARFGK